MNILVTGGAGFIGSNFIRYILNKYPDYKITNIDKLTYAGNLNNLKDIENNPNYSFVKEDICNSLNMPHLVKEKDIIINFAAESHVDNSIISPKDFLRTDVFGTFNLLEAARKNDIKFFQISTDEVYGQIKQGSFTEKSQINPRNPYSASKAAADRLTHSYFSTYELKTFITRASNNFGPFQHPEKLIPKFITNLLQNKKVPLYGEGKQIRDWLFVDDHCSAVDTVLHKAKPGSVYNVGANNEKKNIEITKFLLKELNKPESMIDFVKDRLGHDFRYSLDCSKIKNDLNWSPKSNFQKDLKKTVLWYKNNEWWWKKSG